MKKNKGAAILIVVLFFVILSVTLLAGVAGPVGYQMRNTADYLRSKQGYSIADTQAENTLYRFNKGKSDAPSALSLLGATATASLVDGGSYKDISIQGIIGEFQRFVKTRFKQDVGVAFNYGLQVGIGGLTMGGSAYVTGNVYANGDIVGTGGGGEITGSATAANATDPTPHIDNGGASTPTYSYPFGTVAANQDFAQSIVMATTSPITEIQFYIKKNGNPANATVKIVNNTGAGVPGTTVLASGYLSGSLVTSLYSYVSVIPTTNAALVSGTTYWIVIDSPGVDATNYYTLGLNDAVYTAENPKIGVMSGSWTNIATTTADAYLKISVGGYTGSITNMSIGSAGGDAWARTLTNVDVPAAATLYCQIESGNSEACNTSRADPVATTLPISTANLDQWKEDATDGGSTSTVSLGGGTLTIGPKKINGNLDVSGSSQLYVTGPLYVTGNLTMSGSARINVDPGLGGATGIIVVDGRIDIGGSTSIGGSGTAGSYMIIASASTCPTGAGCSGNDAIEISGSGGAVILSAPNGTVDITGSVSIKSVVAKTLSMNGSSNIVYESGLTDVNFSSGPSGAWTVDTWKEVPSL